MKIHKAYKYRIYPNKEQIEILNQHFGCVRFVYNHYLGERINFYRDTGKGLSFYATEKLLTVFKKQEEYDWLQDVNSQSLQFALRNLERAYVNFFEHRTKFPKFKKKRNRQSFTVPQHFSVTDNLLSIPKCKDIEIKLHRCIVNIV